LVLANWGMRQWRARLGAGTVTSMVVQPQSLEHL